MASIDMLKKIFNRGLGYVGYELRRKVRFGEDTRLVPTTSDFKEYFDKTQGMTSFEEASLLYQLAKETKSGCIVEVGSYRGRSTVALGRGSFDGSKAPVFAIEPHEVFHGVLGGQFGPEDRKAFYQAMLDTASYQIVRLINLSSEVVAPGWSRPIGLLWIDGDHSYEGVKRDFESWAPHLTENAIVAFDDSLDPSIGPSQLVAELLAANSFRKLTQAGKIAVLKENDLDAKS